MRTLRPPPHPLPGSVDKLRLGSACPRDKAGCEARCQARLRCPHSPRLRGPLPCIAVNTASLSLSRLSAHWPFPVLSHLQLARFFCFPQSSGAPLPAPDLAHPAQAGCQSTGSLMDSDSGRPGHLSALRGHLDLCSPFLPAPSQALCSKGPDTWATSSAGDPRT